LHIIKLKLSTGGIIDNLLLFDIIKLELLPNQTVAFTVAFPQV